VKSLGLHLEPHSSKVNPERPALLQQGHPEISGAAVTGLNFTGGAAGGLTFVEPGKRR